MVKVYTQLEENEYRKEYKLLKTMQLQQMHTGQRIKLLNSTVSSFGKCVQL